MVGRGDTAHFYEAQVLVVASAGNDDTDDCGVRYSVDTPSKLLVGATTEGGALYKLSNYGKCVHVQVSSPLPMLRPPVHVRPPATALACPPAPTPSPLDPPTVPHGVPPRMCAGSRRRHPGCGNGLKNSD